MMKFQNKDSLSKHDIESGLRYFMKDAVATQIMTSLTGPTFIIAFAIMLGASNLIIGLLIAIPFLTQLIQIPAIYLVETYRIRRAIYIYAATTSRLFWLVLVLIPFLLSFGIALLLLVLGILLRSAFAAVSTCSWNSWMHDLVPQKELGDFFSSRLTISTTLAVPLTLIAGFCIDYLNIAIPTHVLFGFSFFFFIAFLAGLVGVLFISRISEPQMPEISSNSHFYKRIQEPLKDHNFKNLILFLSIWNFALNFAAPFFTVYMLIRLSFPLSWVLAFSVLNQLTSIVFLRIWGRLTDRMSNKSVLSVTGPLLMVTIFAWTFTTLPTPHLFTLPLLFLIHILMGISSAGVTLASGNIALKLAPKGHATTYLAATSIANSIAAGIAPLIAGLLADILIEFEFAWTLSWTSPGIGFVIHVLSFRHLDFLFVIAFLIGIYSIHRLAYVQEEGEVEEGIMLNAFVSEVRRVTRQFSTLGGLRNMFQIPFRLFHRQTVNVFSINVKRSTPETSVIPKIIMKQNQKHLKK
jgi:MFS family permease